MSKMPELDIGQGELLTESGTQEREGSAVSKAEHHLSTLTLDIELQNLEFICWWMVLLCFCFVPIFSHYVPIPPFYIVTYILCHWVLEVYHLNFNFIGGYN